MMGWTPYLRKRVAKSYAFAPGGTSFDLAARDYVKLRKNTTLLTKDSATPPDTLDSLEEFVAELSGSQVQRPIQDLMLASHGTSLGAMALPLNATLEGDYENVDTVAKAGTCKIPSTVLDPRPAVGSTKPPCRVRVVGCWVGMFPPYLQRFKDMLGGAVEVVAPKHEDAFYTKPDGSMILKGALRYLLYDFRIFSLKPIPTRDELIAKFQAKHKFFNGKDIPLAIWKHAIPTDYDTVGERDVTFQVALKPFVEGFKSIPVKGKYNRGPDMASGFHMPGGPAATASEAVRRAFVEGKLPSEPGFDPTHPLPVFVRDGFTSLAEFAKGYDWTPSAIVADQWNGSRERYMCSVPIWNPANAKREIIYDYLSKSGTVKRIQLLDNLTKLFTLV
jgi:hypothetical protein